MSQGASKRKRNKSTGPATEPKVKSLEVSRKQSDIEILFAQQIALLKLPEPKRNYLFITGRKFELDFAYPDRKIGVAVQGMAHRIKKSFESDHQWRWLALKSGWKVIEIGGKEVHNGQGSQWLQELLQQDVDRELRNLGMPVPCP